LTATLGAINGAQISGDCIGGSITVGVRSPAGSMQSQDRDCGDEPFITGFGEIGDLFVTALPSVRWRVVAGDMGAAEVASAPPASDLQPGETRLVRVDVRAGEPAAEQTATIPAGTDVLYLTAPCNGEGALEIEIDGVAASYTCGAIGIETFTPDFDDQLLVHASATGTAAFAVRVGAVDWEAARPDAWRPPALRLSGPDRTAGDIVTLAAYPGCGWSWEPKGGGGFSTDCGPSWQPMGAALWQRPATMVILHLGGGWTITDVTVEIARNEDILATGRAPGSQPWTVRAMGDEPFVLDVPEPGDWGVRLLVSGERNGDRFQVPDYARIVVEAP